MKTWTCLFAALLVTAGIAIADGREADDITGPWSGEGYVQKDENSRRVKVRCKIEGEQEGDKIQFEGVCRAMLIMKRDIGAWLTRDGDSVVVEVKAGTKTPTKLEGVLSVGSGQGFALTAVPGSVAESPAGGGAIDFTGDCGPVEAPQPQRRRNVLPNRQARVVDELLVDHCDVAIADAYAGHIFAVREDPAGRWRIEARHQSQEGRFSRSGRAKEHIE